MKEKEMKDKDIFAQGVVFGCLFVVYVLFIISIQAWTLMALWKWFVTPFGVPVLGYFHALGLTLLSTYFQKDTLAVIINSEKSPEKAFEIGMTITGMTLMCLILGWFISFLV